MAAATLYFQKPDKPPELGHVNIAATASGSIADEWAQVDDDGLEFVNLVPVVFTGVSLMDSQLGNRVSAWNANAFGGPREVARSVNVTGKSYDVWTETLRFEPMTLTITANRDLW